jgi:rhodanese-related sulfurtransferase
LRAAVPIPSIDAEALRAHLEQARGTRGTILDVRTLEEFRERHIPGALLIPIQEIAARHGELAGRPRPIFVICEHGVRSLHAARFLASVGHRDVMNVRHGMSEWRGPTESGDPLPEAARA